MEDKELLELAAKAAKVDIKYLSDGTPYDTSNCTPWNPLTNNADAFTLASALHMSVSFGPMQSHACTIAGTLRGNSFTELHLDHSMSVESATRIAIVRAAAEIGKSL